MILLVPGSTPPQPPYHVFPRTEDMADSRHGDPGRRVFLPHPECVLCKAGLCAQFELATDEDIVMHGRWEDG